MKQRSNLNFKDRKNAMNFAKQNLHNDSNNEEGQNLDSKNTSQMHTYYSTNTNLKSNNKNTHPLSPLHKEKTDFTRRNIQKRGVQLQTESTQSKE